VLRGVVLQDWTDATLSEQRSAAVLALSRKYTIRRETASTSATAATPTTATPTATTGGDSK